MDLVSGATYEILVSPRSKRDSVSVREGRIFVRVQEPNQDGKANRAVVRLFKDAYAVEIKIVSGVRSKRKRILIRKGGPLPEEEPAAQQIPLL